ncbi:ubiquinone/menaquinone biosynthesis C-methylase UbiE [Kribbella sp. VKM Ac-2571]|uniref:class I SAM-dependent methyltransferase n=1 Tax=Kribbella sp. VKM Ac-2571 TaxID=2512222 RepID=UPI0010EFCF0C|nr:class I SAM-dependent methyltransferase [Kribbella sp. VKM Ac-2571]TDO51149.1 ubiquinone/menaquinone biosynthesis C-methylase UbiE [Kribbella sp. VKM Ac-2571]
MFDYDGEMRFLQGRFRSAWGVRDGDRVLDVGCGGGQTTREAAADVGRGRVVGVDVSERMLEQARRRTADERISYLLADAATYDFGEGSFDVCISRFGVMFFDDPVGAFANLRRALRPGGRLVAMVWQARADNEWAQAIPATIGGDATARDDSPFSLGDPDVARGILTSAGFGEVTFAAVHERLYYGPDVETAYENVLQLREPLALLAELSPADAERARADLRAMLAAHDSGDGILFDSAAWIVTAK